MDDGCLEGQVQSDMIFDEKCCQVLQGMTLFLVAVYNIVGFLYIT